MPFEAREERGLLRLPLPRKKCVAELRKDEVEELRLGAWLCVLGSFLLWEELLPEPTLLSVRTSLLVNCLSTPGFLGGLEPLAAAEEGCAD